MNVFEDESPRGDSGAGRRHGRWFPHERRAGAVLLEEPLIDRGPGTPNPDIDEVTQWAEGIGATTAALGANGIIPIFLGGEEDVSQFRQVAAQLIEHTDLRV